MDKRGAIVTQEESRELLAFVDQAIEVLQHARRRLAHNIDDESTPDDGALYAMPDTRIRRLRAHIKSVLLGAGRPLRSTEIADALWHPGLLVNKDRFLRKVIVNVSAMHKEGSGVVMHSRDGRDALWSVEAPLPTLSESALGLGDGTPGIANPVNYDPNRYTREPLLVVTGIAVKPQEELPMKTGGATHEGDPTNNLGE